MHLQRQIRLPPRPYPKDVNHAQKNFTADNGIKAEEFILRFIITGHKFNLD